MSDISIINVSLTKKDGDKLIPLTSAECVSAINSRLLTVDKSVFNIAILGAYATGTTIPSYIDIKGNTHDEITIDEKNAMRPKDFYKLVQRDHSTFSRWVGALNLIIENGDFNNFASGLYPFNYDKVYIVYNNLDKLVTDDITKLDLLKMSKSTLTAMLATNNSEDDDETSDPSNVEAEAENEAEAEAKNEAENEAKIIDIEIDGKHYAIPLSVLAQYEVVNEG